jgi:hypothetical protein
MMAFLAKVRVVATAAIFSMSGAGRISAVRSFMVCGAAFAFRVNPSPGAGVLVRCSRAGARLF